MSYGLSAVALALTLAALPGTAAEATAQPVAFRSAVDVVGMHVAVTNAERRFVV